MAERRLTDAALERALADLGAHIAYPRTPELSTTVRARIAAGRQRRWPAWDAYRPWPRVAGALAAGLLALAVAVLAISSEARGAVADRLGLGGVRFFAAPESPSPAPAVSPPVPGPRLLGGMSVTLAEARGRAGFALRLPSLPGLGEPDEVYFNSAVPGGAVSLVYAPRPGLPEAPGTGIGLLITQFRGDYGPFLQKGLVAGGLLRPVTVGGAQGYWIEGAPHVLLFRDTAGEVHEERSRLAGNTLLWERDGVTFRLETAAGLDDALRIAESLR
jgi:hypothetical protein